MNPMERFRMNLKTACKLQIEPEMWFSAELADYSRHLASYYQVHGHAMVLAIINGVATNCRSTYINRSTHFHVPCNLFNLIIARSGYSKSSILDLAEIMSDSAARYFAQFNSKQESTGNRSDDAFLSEFLPSSETTSQTETKKTQFNPEKIVFNDGTAAGVLNSLKGCTRTMHLHEADVTLKSLGVMLPSPVDLVPSRIDSFRSTLMTLHEKPGNFLRLLKKEIIDVSGSKLNIFGASTGEIIAAELVRQAASLSSDALFERFVLWPVDGEPIPNENCISMIDYSRYPSLSQFGVFCGFLGDIIIDLEDDGKVLLAEQAFNFRLAGSKDNVKDNVSARLNKTALVCYRVTGFSGLAEAAFDMATDYLEVFVTFGEGQADEVFFSRARKIAENKYGHIMRGEQRLMLGTDVCKRGNEVTVRNLAQYLALMKLEEEDQKSWFGQSNRMLKTTLRHLVVEEKREADEHSMLMHNLAENVKNVNMVLTRKQQNMLQKINHHKASILLHPSLVFLKSGLYINSSLKKTSSLLETSFLQPLVDTGFLLAVPSGLKCRKSKATVYIKVVPSNDPESQEEFSHRLMTLNDSRLTYDSYMASCSSIVFDTLGIISDDVFDILRFDRYQRLNVDLTPLLQHCEIIPREESENVNLAPVNYDESTAADNITESGEDSRLSDDQQAHNNEQLNEMSISNSFETISENSKTSNGGHVVKRKIRANRRTTIAEDQPPDRFAETIAERIRSHQRKRTKTTAK